MWKQGLPIITYALFVVWLYLLRVVLLGSHPLYMAVTLVFLALVRGALVWLHWSMWLALALVIVFVGGIIILFLYVSSISNEEKTRYSLTRGAPQMALSLVLGAMLGGSLRQGAPSIETMTIISLPARFRVIALLYLIVLLLVVIKGIDGFKGALIKSF